MLSENDVAFLKKRKRLAGMWNFVATILLLGLAGLYLWIFLEIPSIANPLYVAEALRQDAVKIPAMEMSAIMLPIVIMVLFTIVAIFILFGFAISSNEKRYLSIIENLLNEQNINNARNQ